MASVLDEVSPAAVVPQLRRRFALLDPEERVTNWENRACSPERLEVDDVNPDRLFFTGQSERTAVRRCEPCVARVQCALRALTEDAGSDYLPEGVVGGLTATERIRILLATPAHLLERKTA